MQMTKRTAAGIAFTFLFFLALVASGVLLSAGALLQAQEKRKDNKIKELLQERLALLTKLANQTTADYKAGKASFDRVHQAQLRMANARLELCESDNQRIAVLEEIVTMARGYEKTADALYSAGKVSISDRLLATAARLDAEIALERAKTKIRAKAK
jgi:outer membrane protein TolC